MAIWRCSITSSFRLLAGLLAGVLLAGCTNLVFVPLRQQVYTPEQLGVQVVDVHLRAADATELFAWQLTTPTAPRGVLCYFHGNAENISTHTANVAWLPAAGYEVLALDYRGYGASKGRAEFPEVFADVEAGLDWCLQRGAQAGVPVFALGQSLGAALLLATVTQSPYREQLAGVIADSGFSGYRQIARDALSHSWLTRPLKYPLSWLLTGDHDPVDAVGDMAPLRLLVLHSRDDRVVPFAHGERIYAAANGAKCLLATSGAHNAAFNQAANREALLAFLAGIAPAEASCVSPSVATPAP